jgi:hypothetical protein
MLPPKFEFIGNIDYYINNLQHKIQTAKISRTKKTTKFIKHNDNKETGDESDDFVHSPGAT